MPLRILDEFLTQLKSAPRVKVLTLVEYYCGTGLPQNSALTSLEQLEVTSDRNSSEALDLS
jgi:hypothetical protein